MFKPTNNVIIAFDGVAPLAKLNQQRSRRYKSWFQTNISNHILNKECLIKWNTACITPGTIFMNQLSYEVSNYFNIDFSKKNKIKNTIVSGSNKLGEGEHKIYDFIRNNSNAHKNETTIVYGLDADLIMLSINHLHICSNIFLYRETPHFISSIDESINPLNNYLLDINELSRCIVLNMTSNDINDIDNVFNFSLSVQYKLIHDYVFLSFLMGNDFLPHFPALNIRTNGINKIMNAYKMVISNNNIFLTDGNVIVWNNLRKLIHHLSMLEEQYFIDEHISREKMENRLTNTDLNNKTLI